MQNDFNDITECRCRSVSEPNGDNFPVKNYIDFFSNAVVSRDAYARGVFEHYTNVECNRIIYFLRRLKRWKFETAAGIGRNNIIIEKTRGDLTERVGCKI